MSPFFYAYSFANCFLSDCKKEKGPVFTSPYFFILENHLHFHFDFA
jgi:hypothetical protein